MSQQSGHSTVEYYSGMKREEGWRDGSAGKHLSSNCKDVDLNPQNPHKARCRLFKCSVL